MHDKIIITSFLATLHLFNFLLLFETYKCLFVFKVNLDTCIEEVLYDSDYSKFLKTDVYCIYLHINNSQGQYLNSLFSVFVSSKKQYDQNAKTSISIFQLI